MKKIIFFLLFTAGMWQHALAQAPNEPTSLVVTPINNGGMVKFTAPSSVGGSAITNYEYSTDNGSSWVTPSPESTVSPLIISSGLTNCTTYQLKLRAVNASGSGTASVAASLTPGASTGTIGSTWTSRTSAADNSWISVTYGNGLFVAVAYGSVMTSPDGITWTSRTSAAGNNWLAITYGNGLFVAVSNTGTNNRVMTSPDGITWTSRTSAVDNEWNGVTYGNGLFVAVAGTGTGNRVMTSSDGITWTSRTSAANNTWKSVTYGKGLFVAVSTDGTNRVMTSSNGITWISRTSAANNDWNSVTCGNGLFVAIALTGTGNRVMTSSNGITWTTRTSATDNSWNSVTYGNGLFVAIAFSGTGNRVMSSPDGFTWTSRTSAADNLWTSVTYGNGLFVAVAQSGTGNRVMTSSYSVAADAPVISAITTRNNAVKVAFTQTASVYAPAVSNYEYSTNNGNTWSALNPISALSPLTITGLTNGTNYDIKIRAINAVGTSCTSASVSATPALGTAADAPTNLVVTPINTGGMIQFTAPTNDGGSNITNYEYSTDGGANWVTPSPATTVSPLIISSGLTNCTTYQLKLRAVNASGSGTASVAASLTPGASTGTIGSTWTSRTSAADNSWYGVTYGNGIFVAVAQTGTGNRVMTSPDGITWTSRTSAANLNWSSVIYGNGLFVAVAQGGTGNRVMTSPDGITWTRRTSAADNNNWNRVIYGNGLFVAVAGSGTGNRVMTSPDGITWTSRTSAADNDWQGITYGNGLFVAVATSGTGNRVMTSPDGINWTIRTSAANNQWNSVTYGNGIFVAVAGTGTGNGVMTSPDGITWTSRTPAVDNAWRCVTYGNSLFVAVGISGTGNRVMTSPDGITWTSRVSASDNNWLGVTYGNGLFVAVAITGTGNRVMTSSYAVAADAPVITSATFGSSTTINFTQSSSALAPSITNYEYSTDYGSNWTAVSPAATTSPLTINGLETVPSSILIRAVNSVGSSCASNKYEKTIPTINTAPVASSIIYGQTLANSQLSGGVASVAGTFAFTTPSTVPNRGTANQEYTFTPTDANNYYPVTGMVSVTVNYTAAPTALAQTFCAGATVADLVATGVNLKWFTAVTDGAVLASNTMLTTATYYVSQTVNGIESDRTSVSITINARPTFAGGTFYINNGLQIQNVFGNQNAYLVYSTNVALAPLAGTTILNAGNYFGTYSQNGCESSRAAVTIVTYATPTISWPRCGSVLTAMSAPISATTVANATNYLFEVTGNGSTQTFYSNTNSFNLTQLQGSAVYNTAYSIRVAAGFNGQYGNFGSACSFTTPALANTTQVIVSQCGTILASMTTPIYCGQIVNAQAYRFEFTSAGVSRTLDSAINNVQISNLVGGAAYNTAYSVRVAAQVAGIWQDYGYPCTVTTPAASTQIRTNQCGTTLATKWSILYCGAVTGATAYRFEWKNGGTTLTFANAASNMQLGNYTGWAVNTTYSVRVAAQISGTWQDYGTACNIKTPASIARGVSENETALTVKAVPNPFETEYVLMAQGGNETPVQVSVYDMLGKQVEQFSVEANELENRSLGTNYTSGIYNVMISQGDDQQVVRIIKK